MLNSHGKWSVVVAEAGQGVRVAIIDSGILPNHPMFADAGFTAPETLPGNDYLCHDRTDVL